jgi:hypothetical protein
VTRLPRFLATDDPLEKTIERKVRIYAKTLGIHCFKYTTPARRSAPDRICFTSNGRVFFLELKAKGNKPTKAQALEHDFYRSLGFYVFWCDNIEEGKRIMEIMA